MEEWRTILYPIGFLANILFAIRFFLQWIDSEKKAESFFPASFWLISLAGSLLMSVHSFIQIQYPVCLIQTCNIILYWRNWNLTQYEKSLLLPLKQIFLILFILIILVTFAFTIGSYWALGRIEWMHQPDYIENTPYSLLSIWYVMGFFGTFLFASRFWLHWWRAEHDQDNVLDSQFWILSLVGSLFALAYFIRIYDLVNIIGYSAGLIPYLRNLFLVKKTRLSST